MHENLLDLLADAPPDSIISRTLHKDDQVNISLFSFDAGQALSDHSAATPAVIHILSGEAQVGLGDDKFELKAGAWMHMAARLTHSVLARTPMKMLLILLRQSGD
ncbi:MAG: cupin domain-containing protein [Chloroflexi bacterium]|nr:cupin domain-containing protein [Chloroflexota bacterium]